jgi:hypothetical protein
MQQIGQIGGTVSKNVHHDRTVQETFLELSSAEAVVQTFVKFVIE